jgi:hypothetical protein
MAVLNVNDTRTASKKRITFGDLSIGEVYEDGGNFLCIKTDSIHCIYMNDEKVWDTILCDVDEVVFPLRATLTIEGRE